jgi:hypothetical protein
MAKKEVSIAGGKITVIVQDKYDVYEKDVPSNADPDINWLGNFGISEKASNKKLDGKVPKYEIHISDEDGKKLVYWSGSQKIEVPGQQTITKKGKKFRKGELDLGDPAVGWDR